MNQKYWSRRAASITPYVAGEQPKLANLVKLNTNENPYPPSPRVREVLEGFDPALLRLYPEPESDALRAAIGQANGLPADWVFAGNGSDEVLALCFQCFFDGDLVFPDITYSFYPVWAQLYGITCRQIALNQDFTLPTQQFVGQTNVVFPNPNAPTSMAISLDEVEQIVRTASGVVVVDEAYIAYGGQTALPLLQKYDNLVIVRTFSKSHSLAGLRVGYALAHPDLIAALRCVKDSFNSYPLDKLAQAAAAAAIADSAYTEGVLQKIVATRQRTAAALQELGFAVLPSSANFLFCAHRQVSAASLMAQLREDGIIVRHFSKPRIENWLRITIGTDAEMERLLARLKEILP